VAVASAGQARPLILFLMGPTASGKTDLALRLRDHLPVELISVDSAQIYRGMDIGTAKPDAETLARHPHRLIDILDPVDPYSVAHFVTDAHREIADIIAVGKIPLLVGGSMLYFRALLDGLAELPPPSPQIRAQIAREAEGNGWPALHAQLALVDPDSAARFHPNHSRRIQRALEVYRATGKSLTSVHQEQLRLGRGTAALGETCRVVACALSGGARGDLHSRIAQRFGLMLERGLVEEVAKLRARGDLLPTATAMRAAGYRQIWSFLDGDCDYQDAVQKGVIATRQLAKRQLTWLRSWPDLHWLDIDSTTATLLSTSEILTNYLKILKKETIY